MVDQSLTEVMNVNTVPSYRITVEKKPLVSYYAFHLMLI
jgi:hypothetical protein